MSKKKDAPSSPDLAARTLAKLAGSGLTKKHAELMQVAPYSAAQVTARFPGIPLHLGGFQVPYFSVEGKRTDFYRFRYLEQQERSGFAALLPFKPLRYGQPADSLTEIYLPPFKIGGATWAQIAENTATSLVITEGELKAACLCAHGVPAIGLGGVWSFCSKGAGRMILPSFNALDWTRRKVFILFDSDAATNPSIVGAENALAKTLADTYAVEPYLIRLPAVPELEGKTGVDDYVQAYGVAAVARLIEEAEPWLAQQELHALNAEVVYVRRPGVILRYSDVFRMAPSAFTGHAYRNRIMTVTNAGGKHETRHAADEWLAWSRRAEVAATTYAPGNSEKIVDGQYNTWEGWGCLPAEGSVQPFLTLVDAMFPSEVPIPEAPEARTNGHAPLLTPREWFLCWLAYPLQNPGAKLMTAVALWSRATGNGKSTIGETMKRIYGRNYIAINNAQLENSFNEWADSRQFVMGDEVTGNDRRQFADKLKGMITQTEVYINKKHLPMYAIPDCISYYFTSNHPDAFQLDDCDRRFFVHQVPEHGLTTEWFGRYYQWLEEGSWDEPARSEVSVTKVRKGIRTNLDTVDNGVGRIVSGASALFYYLVTQIDCSRFNPAAPAPVTGSKRQMMGLTRSDLGSWVAALKESPDTVLRVAGENGGTVVKSELWSSEDIRKLYDPDNRGRVTANGISRELVRAGFKLLYSGNPVVITPELSLRLWALRSPAKWSVAAGPLLAAQYLRERPNLGQFKKFERGGKK